MPDLLATEQECIMYTSTAFEIYYIYLQISTKEQVLEFNIKNPGKEYITEKITCKIS